jgi:hypothetical protein
MALPIDAPGRVYTFKSNPECSSLGLPTPVLPGKVHDHIVLVVEIVPRKPGCVTVMTVSAQTFVKTSANSLQITSMLKDDGDYVSISPT